MRFRLSIQVQQKIEHYHRYNPELVQKIKKQLKIFSLNRLHPSLRTHKLSGKLSDSWSISIDRSMRMLYTLLPDGVAYFYLIGTHDEVYRK